MEGSKPNTSKFRKSRKNELSLILTLLFLALIAAGYLFLSENTRDEMQAQDKASTNEQIISTDPQEVKDAFTSLDSLNNRIGETIRELQNEMSADQQAAEKGSNNSINGEMGTDSWIVTGLFGEIGNAEKMIQKLESAGYEAETIQRENGALAVGIPANSENRVLLEKVRHEIAKDAYFYRKN